MINSLKPYILFLVFLSGTIISYAQTTNPGTDTLFMPREVVSVYITMTDADKAFLLADENKNSEEYLPATFRLKNSLIDTTLSDEVGIRLRGNTSRSHSKKSFKIKFKEFEGSKFYGQKKLNLKADNNDPSALREMMTLRMFREADVPAARSFHTKVYMNGEYMGHYINVEQIDDEFALTRFGNDTGNLYKCSWPTTLENDGQIYNETQYELETNKDINDRSILANFVRVLNETADEDFKTEIEKVLNVNSLINYFAVEALIGHWDGYSYLKNNLYIYENPVTGLVEIIPYDVDNTYGIDWIGRDWAQRDITDWAKHDEPRPLNTRILSVPEYREQYYNEINNLIETIFNEEYLFPEFDFYKNLLASCIAEDSYYPKTFGFNLTSFLQSFDKKVANHAPYGLKPYVTTRVNYARQQIPATFVTPQFSEVSLSVYPNPSDGKFICISTGTSETLNQNFRVFNYFGQEMRFSTVNSSGNQKIIFDDHLPSGMYILEIGDNHQKFIVK
ncbi:MAG: CotH kinase family protein [Prolixibacteraceae bacterium]|nr:CotH kinase family protein [Prolixibacteraceae bacterium]